MSGKAKVVVLGIAGVMALLAVPLLFAAGRGAGGECPMGLHGGGMRFGGWGHGGGHAKMGALIEELDLTAEQRESLHAIFRKAHERSASSREGLHAALLDAAKVLGSDPANVAGARAAFDARQPSLEELETTILESMAEAMAVLTPEQRTRLAQHLERHGRAVPE